MSGDAPMDVPMGPPPMGWKMMSSSPLNHWASDCMRPSMNERSRELCSKRVVRLGSEGNLKYSLKTFDSSCPKLYISLKRFTAYHDDPVHEY